MAKVIIELDTLTGSSDDILLVSALGAALKATYLSINNTSENHATVAKVDSAQEASVSTVTVETTVAPPSATKTATSTRRKSNISETAVQVVDVSAVAPPPAAVAPPPAAVAPPPAAVAPPPAAVAPPPAAVAPPPAAVAPPPAAAVGVKQAASSFTRVTNRLMKIVTPTTPGYNAQLDMKKLRELIEIVGIKNGVAGLKDASEEQLLEAEAMVESFASGLGMELPA